VVEGLAHLGAREGALHTYDGRTWKTFCDSSEDRLANWNLPPTSLEAIAFDAKGRPCVLSGYLGLLCRDGGKWIRLTPDWPGHQYLSSLQLTPAGVAVIGTYDAGVLLLNIQSKEVRRVTLRP
jgi:hypothetical protein